MQGQWMNLSEDQARLARGIFLLLGSKSSLMKFLFEERAFRLRARPGILRDQAWNFTEAEQLQVRVVLDIWSGSGQVELWELLESWEAEQWARFIAAIRELKSLASRPSC